MKHVDLLIIGGGSAGLSAAVSAYDNGVENIIILESTQFLGGILNQCIHNGFGLSEFKEELTGPEFADRFIKLLKERNIDFYLETSVTDITKDKIVTYQNTDGVYQVQAESIINCAGCYERNAGAISIPGERPSGVLTAGQAQLYLNQYGFLPGKKVFILGSGDIGLIMARRLTWEGAEVLGVAEIMPWSNGLNRNIVQCLNDFNIPLHLSHTITNIIGKDRLEAIELTEVDEQFNLIPNTTQRIEVDTLILSIGLIPNNDLYNSLGIISSKTKGSEVDEYYQTSIPGFFSCGNVLHVHDLVDNVVEEARQCGYYASEYLKGNLNFQNSTNITSGEGIGYVIPQKIYLKDNEKITFKFRVRKPLKNVDIIYSQNNKIIRKIHKPVIIPSEMEIQTLNKTIFDPIGGDITVSVLLKEDK